MFVDDVDWVEVAIAVLPVVPHPVRIFVVSEVHAIAKRFVQIYRDVLEGYHGFVFVSIQIDDAFLVA